jgi:alpha-L-arabinofuranosidase
MWWTGYGNYAGLLGQGNFGPCMVWNDAVTNFATPPYYMQKMLFVDNAGTRVLPFTQNTAHCFWSASLDAEAGRNDVLLKVVNKSGAPESVNIILTGVREIDPAGHYTLFTGALAAENSLANPASVVSSSGVFAAGGNFSRVFPANSMTALRVKLLR